MTEIELVEDRKGYCPHTLVVYIKHQLKQKGIKVADSMGYYKVAADLLALFNSKNKVDYSIRKFIDDTFDDLSSPIIPNLFFLLPLAKKRLGIPWAPKKRYEPKEYKIKPLSPEMIKSLLKIKKKNGL